MPGGGARNWQNGMYSHHSSNFRVYRFFRLHLSLGVPAVFGAIVYIALPVTVFRSYIAHEIPFTSAYRSFSMSRSRCCKTAMAAGTSWLDFGGSSLKR